MFAVGYGFTNRATNIRKMLASDHNTAVILAAVHFEWTLKRALLALGESPTVTLREELESTHVLTNGPTPKKTVQSLWNRELNHRKPNSALGKVLPNFPKPITDAKDVRGKIIHGNGTVSKSTATDAVENYLWAAEKIYTYARSQSIDIDNRLITRRRKSAS